MGKKWRPITARGVGGKLRAELSSVVLPFNSWYDTEEREGGQCRGIKHERDEERFDRLPRSVTPRGTCPDHVSRWQVLCVCACSHSAECDWCTVSTAVKNDAVIRQRVVSELRSQAEVETTASALPITHLNIKASSSTSQPRLNYHYKYSD